MRRREYENTTALLKVEFMKAQKWVKEEGERIVALFEGRDAAGKGGTMKRFMEHLNPRLAQVVALEKPTEYELGSGIFSAMLGIYLLRGRWRFSTVPGTTVQEWNW